MKRFFGWTIAIGLFVGFAIFGAQQPVRDAQPSNTQSQAASLAVLAKSEQSLPPAPPLILGVRSKTEHCAVSGALPDHDCSPGAVFPAATVYQICVQGYSRSVRAVTVKLKKQIYASYDIAYPQPTGSYELDHLIPLELGGSNDAANLFPEAAAPKPGFREKDLVENFLHNEVCAGSRNLTTAQMQIAENWRAVYDSLTPEQIAALKQEIFDRYGRQ